MNTPRHPMALSFSEGISAGDKLVVVTFDQHGRITNAKDNPDCVDVRSVNQDEQYFVGSIAQFEPKKYSFDTIGLPMDRAGADWSPDVCVMRYGIARNVMRAQLGTTSTAVNKGFSVDRDMMLLVGGSSVLSPAIA